MTATIQHNINGYTATDTVQVPQTWNDCTLRQAAQVYNIITSTNTDLHVKRLMIAKLLVTITDANISLMKADSIAEWGEEAGTAFFLDELNAICTQVAGPFFEITETEDEPPRKEYAIRLGLTKCPYPYVEYKSHGQPRRLYAAADGFANMTIYELGTVFTLFERWMETNNKNLLFSLLATIYRPAKPETPENKAAGYHGDIRRPLRGEENKIAQRKGHWEFVPVEIIQLIVFWVASCRDSIIKEYPIIFSQKKDDETPEGKNYGWAGLILKLSGGVVNINVVADQPYSTVFLHLAMLEDARRLALLRQATNR